MARSGSVGIRGFLARRRPLDLSATGAVAEAARARRAIAVVLTRLSGHAAAAWGAVGSGAALRVEGTATYGATYGVAGAVAEAREAPATISVALATETPVAVAIAPAERALAAFGVVTAARHEVDACDAAPSQKGDHQRAQHHRSFHGFLHSC